MVSAETTDVLAADDADALAADNADVLAAGNADDIVLAADTKSERRAGHFSFCSSSKSVSPGGKLLIIIVLCTF